MAQCFKDVEATTSRDCQQVQGSLYFVTQTWLSKQEVGSKTIVSLESS